MKLSERILAAWAEKEWPGQQMQGWADEVAKLEAENEALKVAELRAENEELQELFVYFFGENYKVLAKG